MNETINLTSLDFLFISIFILIIISIIGNKKKDKNKTIKIIIKNNDELINNIKNTSSQLSDNFKEITSNFYDNKFDNIKNLIDKKLLNSLKIEKENLIKKDLIENRNLIDVENVKITSRKNNKLLVEFSSIQTFYKTDKNGKIIQGNKNKIIKVKDFWLFKKNSRNKWILEEVVDIKTFQR